MEQKTVDYSRINYGISLLKALMTFEVLLSHFADWKEYDPRLVWPFRELVSLAVPCFAIISFFLTAEIYANRNEEKFIKRLFRLVIPQIAWAIVYYVVYVLIDLLMHKGLHSGISDLFWQLLTGHSRYLNPSMWFQVDVIIITILFFLVFKIKKDDAAYLVLLSLMAISYILQFTGINWSAFGNLEFELKYPLGRIVEMIPYAVIGFFMKRFDIFEKIKKYRYLIMGLCVVLFLLGFQIPWTFFDDFGYAGLAKPYLSLCVITFAYLVPFDQLSIAMKKVILKITDYTLGIYCIHRLINTLLIIFVPSLGLRSFERCIFIYVLSYFTCLIIDLLSGKAGKQTVK